MAGSGFIFSNVLKIANSGINNIHFTARKSIQNSTKLGKCEFMNVDEGKISNIVNLLK